MRRKLLIVNLALVALAAGGLWKLRVDYRQAWERYKVLNAEAGRGTVHGAPMGEPAGLPPVQPAAFLEAAEKHLFSPDRNPTVVVEPKKVKPRPALPQLFGVMSLAGSPIAIMAEKQGAPHKTIRLGETIGEFKLLAAAGDQITLEWEGQKIEAQVSEVLVQPASQEATRGSSPILPSGPPPAASQGATVTNPTSGRGEFLIGPQVQTATGTIYQSPPGDSAPHGTVYQGKRKVVRQTPFGTQSWWEDVKN